MTTTERTAMRVALERAANRAHDDGEDEVSQDVLDALITAAEQQSDGSAEQVKQLREENGRLADDVAARQRSLEETEQTVAQLRRELRTAVDEGAAVAERVNKLRVENNELREAVKVAEAAAQVAASPQHTHAYPWDAPDELPGPCGCGKPFPGDTDEGDEVEPELTPWGELMLTVRTELADWNPGEDR